MTKDQGRAVAWRYKVLNPTFFVSFCLFLNTVSHFPVVLSSPLLTARFDKPSQLHHAKLSNPFLA
jgi:hypothetical protein